MKFLHSPLLFVLSLVAFSAALPVDVQSSDQGRSFQVRDVSGEIVFDELAVQKRDNALLTALFTSLNNSLTISSAKAALQLSLTQDQGCKFIGSLITTKGLTNLLEAADTSGLGLDLVLMVLTHFEFVSGLVDVVDYYKDDYTSNSTSTSSSSNSSSTSTSSSSTSTSSGLLSSILSGVSGLLGLDDDDDDDSSSSSSSSSATATTTASSGLLDILGDLLGSDSTTTATSSAKTTTTSATTAVGTATGTSTTTAFDLAGLLGLTTASTVTTSTATAVTSTTSTTTGTKTTATTTGTKTTSTTSTATATSTGLVSSILGGVSSILGDILKREELADLLEREGINDMVKRDDADAAEILTLLIARATDGDFSEIEKRDIFTTIYSQIISLVGTDSNVEEICESLASSGLARNFVYNLVMDSGFYAFDAKLWDYLSSNDILTGSILVKSLYSSGIVVKIGADLITNSTYFSELTSFILGIFTGKVAVIALILALV